MRPENSLKFAVVDVTTNKVISTHETHLEASGKADRRPRDWMVVHVSNLQSMLRIR